jgi:hypothetical protein
MIKNLEEKTGKKFSEWISIVKNSGLEKHGEIMKLLKSDTYGLTHGYANLVAHKAKETDAGSAASEESLVDDQYKGKESLRPIYDSLISEIKKFGNDVELAPKRAYVSLRRKKQFGLIQPSTKTRVDIGINTKGKEPEGSLEIAGSWNSMVSHRVKITEPGQVTPKVISWLREAYEAAG